MSELQLEEVGAFSTPLTSGEGSSVLNSGGVVATGEITRNRVKSERLVLEDRGAMRGIFIHHILSLILGNPWPQRQNINWTYLDSRPNVSYQFIGSIGKHLRSEVLASVIRGIVSHRVPVAVRHSPRSPVRLYFDWLE